MCKVYTRDGNRLGGGEGGGGGGGGQFTATQGAKYAERTRRMVEFYVICTFVFIFSKPLHFNCRALITESKRA